MLLLAGGKSQAVFAFADNEKAASLLKQGLKVGETSLTTGTSGNCARAWVECSMFGWPQGQGPRKMEKEALLGLLPWYIWSV